MLARSLGRFAFAAALTAAPVMPGFAADLPATPEVFRPVRVGPVRDYPAFNWTGCHVGVHIGYGFPSTTASGQFIDPTVPSTFGAPTSIVLNSNPVAPSGEGAIGGGQVGCDLQLGSSFLIGFDADASGANISGNIVQTQSVGLIGPIIPAVTNVSSNGLFSQKTNFITTATGRVGYVYLVHGVIYGKGGLAWTDNKYDFNGNVSTDSCRIFNPVSLACTLANPTVVTPFDFNSSEMRRGWTVGGGIEWAFVNDWSIKVEYDYLGFGSQTLSFTGPGTGTTSASVDQHISEVKFGLNYLIGN